MLPPDLLIVGDLLIDVVTERPRPPVPGVPHGSIRFHPAGSASNAAAWAAAAGATVSIVGAVGEDLAGHMLTLALNDRGVDVSRVRAVRAPTGAMVLGDHPEKAIVASRGANALLRVEDLPPALLAGAVLVSGYTVADPSTEQVAREACARARAPHVAVHASPFTAISRRGTEWFFDATRGATILLANDGEAEVLSGARDEAAARILSARYRLVVVTLGEDGVVLASEGVVSHVPAPSISEVDPTGAGDAFAGVFLATLVRGGTVVDAAALGCRAGARCAAQEPRWPSVAPPGDLNAASGAGG